MKSFYCFKKKTSLTTTASEYYGSLRQNRMHWSQSGKMRCVFSLGLGPIFPQESSNGYFGSGSDILGARGSGPYSGSRKTPGAQRVHVTSNLTIGSKA